MISFVTDIEGDLAYFERFVAASLVITFDDSGALDFETPDGRFVFGGDLFDRGPGDMRLSRLLCDFYDRYPDRVVLLAGNRDINKMRFSSELGTADSAPGDAFSAWWDPRAPTLAQYLQTEELSDSPLIRLQWALHHTLGCPKTFEYRRQELSILHAKDDVSDALVLQSFVDGVTREDGFYYEYLKRAQLVARIGDSLFIHGAADSRGLGFVPSVEMRFIRNPIEDVVGKEFANLDEWVGNLNEFLRECIRDWRGDLRWRQDGKRGGDALMAYQNKISMHNRTVCVHSYVDGMNMPSPHAYQGGEHRSGFELRSNPLDDQAVSYLMKGEIRRVFVGHTPSGSAAAILKTANLEFCSADTNYGGRSDGDWVEIIVPAVNEAATRVRGKCEGGEYDCLLELPVGKQIHLDDGEPFWVKLQFKSGEYLVSRGAGRHVENRIIDEIKA